MVFLKNIDDINSFVLELNAPYSLNYLIFIQNITLNNSNDDKPLFPYLDSTNWGLKKDEEFAVTFREVWNTAVQKNRSNRKYDHNGILKYDFTLYKSFFENNEKGIQGFNESIKSFLAWWNRVYGKLAVQSVVEPYGLDDIYRELSKSIKTSSEKRLYIDLIYDKPAIAQYIANTWHCVVPVEEILHTKYREKLLAKLLKCCDTD